MSNGDKASQAATLARLKAEHFELAREDLLQGDFDGAAAGLRKVDLIERLAPATRPRGPVLPYVAMGLVCASVLLVLAAWKLKATQLRDLQVSIRGRTTAAQLTLAGPTTVESFRGAAVDLGRLDSLSAQMVEIPDRPDGDLWVRVAGAHVEVRGLHAANETQLTFTLAQRSGAAGAAKTLAVRAHTTGIGGELQVLPGAIVSTGMGDEQGNPGSKLSGDVSDIVSFGCASCLDVPFRLDVRDIAPFILGNVPVNTLAFAEDHVQPDGTVYFTSGLRDGAVRVLDVDRTEVIERGDRLRLSIAQTRRFEIGLAEKDDALSFVFEGTVAGLALGPVGAEKDLAPSLLELLYRQKALALLWGGAVFLWGLFVGVAKLWKGVRA